MRKIPILFLLDDNWRATDKVNPDCEWVLRGEGVATIKMDGTCCLVEGGEFYRRRGVKEGEDAPQDWFHWQHWYINDWSPNAGEGEAWGQGWVPVGDGAEDIYHREAMAQYIFNGVRRIEDDTYELVGPKVQGNPYHLAHHALRCHGEQPLFSPRQPTPITFSFGLLKWFFSQDPHMEGLVWHHEDGRMAKLRCRDFGATWTFPRAGQFQL